MSAFLGGVPHPVCTEVALKHTMISWVTAKTFTLLKLRIRFQSPGHRPTATGSEIIMTWTKKKKRAAWRLMVLQCSFLLHSPHPTSLVWVKGWKAVRNLLLLSQRLLGKQRSQLRAAAVAHTITHRLTRLDHQPTHPQAQSTCRGPPNSTLSFFAAIPHSTSAYCCCSSYFLSDSRVFSADAVTLCFVMWLHSADFQKTASSHRAAADIKCWQVWSLVPDQFSY